MSYSLVSRDVFGPPLSFFPCPSKRRPPLAAVTCAQLTNALSVVAPAGASILTT